MKNFKQILDEALPFIHNNRKEEQKKEISSTNKTSSVSSNKPESHEYSKMIKVTDSDIIEAVLTKFNASGLKYGSGIKLKGHDNVTYFVEEDDKVYLINKKVT